MASKRNSAAALELPTLAAGQRGVVSRRQLRGLGFSESAIGRLAQTGHLHRVYRGVYAVGHPAIGRRGRLRAATLACGDGSVISHRSAAALLGLLDRGPEVIDVIGSGAKGRKIDGIRAHSGPALRRGEAGTVDGIPCTSPARTIVDCSGVIGLRSLRSVFERAAARRILDVEAIESGGRRGVGALRTLIEEWREAAPVAEEARLKSPLEAMVLPILASRGIAWPQVNAPVDLVAGRIEVDFLWAEQRFVLEADSRDFHGTRVAFERDRWRDRELLRAGFTTLRVTRRQAEVETVPIADAICRQLTSGGASVSAHSLATS